MEESGRVDLEQLKQRLAKLGVHIQEPVRSHRSICQFLAGLTPGHDMAYPLLLCQMFRQSPAVGRESLLLSPTFKGEHIYMVCVRAGSL